MISTSSKTKNNDDILAFPVKVDLQKNTVNLELEDKSFLRLDHHNRPLEHNVLSSYGISTSGPIFFFTGLQSNNQGKGQASFLMDCASMVLDQAGYWVLNEVRPTDFSEKNLDRLIEFYERYNYELLQKGKDAALMYRRPRL